MHNNPPINISFLLLDHMLATSCTLPMEMLQAAEARAEISLSADKFRPLHITTTAETYDPILTYTGIKLIPDKSFNEADAPDLIYIPGLWRNPRPIIKKHAATLAWIKEQNQIGTTISAVGTGCCLLAETGLLDNKAATTHWHYFDQFQRDYPKVQLKRQYFITQAGNLYCAASVNSLADLTVHFIQRFYGSQIASQVERHFSHEIRQSYETSGYFENAINPHPDEDITQIQVWLEDNYAKDISIAQIANHFGMSVRTLNRRFKAANNKTPIDYLQDKRIHVAKDLLHTSNLNINEIADRVGYRDPSYFSQTFKKYLGTTPMDYRKTVRKKLFSTPK